MGRNKLSEYNNLEALEYLKTAAKHCIDYDFTYDIFIYKGFAEFQLYDFELSIMSYQYALQLVKANKKLNDDEKKYLMKYILEDLIDALKIMKLYNNLDKYEEIYRNITYDKNNIKSRILKKFPMKQ